MRKILSICLLLIAVVAQAQIQEPVKFKSELAREKPPSYVKSLKACRQVKWYCYRKTLTIRTVAMYL